MFNHYYNNATQKAEKLPDLILEKCGSEGIDAATQEFNFTAEQWSQMDEAKREETLQTTALHSVPTRWLTGAKMYSIG